MMLRLLRQAGEVCAQAEQVDDFSRLSMAIAGDVHPFELGAVSGLQPTGEATHVWFSVEALRAAAIAQVERSQRASWLRSFDEMVSQAAQHGWVSDAGVRIHIVDGTDNPSGCGAPVIPSELSLRDTFSVIPAGVLALGALSPVGPVGMAVSSFTNLSIDPPLIAVCIREQSETWPKLAAAKSIGVSLLSSGQQAAAKDLSVGTSDDRFAQIDYAVSPTGAVLVREAAAWYETVIAGTHSGGDHQIVLLQIMQCARAAAPSPMVFYESSFRTLAEA